MALKKPSIERENSRFLGTKLWRLLYYIYEPCRIRYLRDYVYVSEIEAAKSPSWWSSNPGGGPPNQSPISIDPLTHALQLLVDTLSKSNLRLPNGANGAVGDVLVVLCRSVVLLQVQTRSIFMFVLTFSREGLAIAEAILMPFLATSHWSFSFGILI